MKERAPEVPALSLYVHVPFCLRRCSYCDFASEQRRDGSRVACYLDGLAGEAARSERRGSPVGTVYLGGGTPTALTDAELDRVFEIVSSNFDVSRAAEVTVEANPGTVDEGRLERLRGLGVNRLSLGIQTFSDAGLRLLGRAHDSREAARAFEAARAAGFDNVSADLMFALPGQEPEDVRRDLEHVIELGPEHVSVYGLTYESGTRLTRLRDEGALVPVEEETERAMYLSTIDGLSAAGYVHYEISNFAREGFECVHNLTYWSGGEYVGLGPSAASYLAGERRRNVSALDDYTARVLGRGSPVAERERLAPDRAAREMLMLALRTRRGTEGGDFESRTGRPLSAALGPEGRMLVEEGWLEWADGRLRLARKALPVADEVLSRII